MSTDERHAWRMLGKEDTARTNIKVVQMANRVSQREREREREAILPGHVNGEKYKNRALTDS